MLGYYKDMAEETGAPTPPLSEVQKLKDSSSSGSGLEKATDNPGSKIVDAFADDLIKKQLDPVVGADIDTAMRDLAGGMFVGRGKAGEKLKSPETIKAQVAAFAAERVKNYTDSGHVIDNLESIAQGDTNDVTRVTDSAEYHTDEDGKSVRVPEGTERTVATKADYVDFLRSVGGSKYEAVRGRAEMLKAYSELAPTIERLKNELANPATRDKNPAFIGRGSNAMVFKINQDGKDYAVRVPRGKATNPSVIDSHLAGAVLGKGVPHLEQIVAASYEDGVTVAEMMPGKEVGNMTLDDIQKITDTQLSGLVDTLIAVSDRGIEIDPKPSNIFYDPESGFGIVDYHSSKVVSKNSADQDLGKIVGWMSTPIDNAGFYGKKYNPEKKADDYARDLEFHKANLDVLRRYRTVVNGKLEGEVRQKALEDIDAKITYGQSNVENYSNPQWVAEAVARDAEYARQRAEQPKTDTKGVLKLDLV